MDTILSLLPLLKSVFHLSAAQVLILLAMAWVFSATLHKMPDPTPTTGLAYRWLYGLLHSLGANLPQVALALKAGVKVSGRAVGRVILLVCLVGATGFSLRAADHAMYPDAKLTPGATDGRVTQATIQKTVCQVGYTTTVRDVTEAEKAEVLRRYGIRKEDTIKTVVDAKTGKKKVIALGVYDHLISLELGGTNAIANIWFQFYDAAPGQSGYLGARDKDVVETNFAHRMCKGEITLEQAQRLIRTDWVAAYQSIKKGLDPTQEIDHK